MGTALEPAGAFARRNAARLAQARAFMAENDATLQRLESFVEQCWAAEEWDGAAAWAQIAGHFAYLHHPGRFASPRLERVLNDIGRRVIVSTRTEPLRPAGSERVLHVLTEAYDTGGHSRFAWRWIERDHARRHDVMLTNPQSLRPDALETAVAAAGGTVHVARGSSLVKRAQQLRELADAHDLVVLHTHMHDVVPLIALAERPAGPPVVFEEHADHVFWLGTSIADAVVNGRAVGRALAADRRFVEPARSVHLPVPVPPIERTLTREQAKRALGLDPATPVLLTVGHFHKFAPVVEPSLCELALPVLRRHADAVLIAVGPEHEGQWAEAGAATDGRVRAAGTRTDLTAYYHAADVYLDSFPFGSNTAMLEAAAHGTPVVSFDPDPEQQGLLRSNPLGFEDEVVRAGDAEEWAASVTRLLGDAQERTERGARSAAGLRGPHSGAAWAECLEHVYAVARALGPAALLPPPRVAPPAADFEAIHLLLFIIYRERAPLSTVAAFHGAVVPERFRQVTLPTGRVDRPGWTAVAAPAPDPGSLARAVEALAAVHAERQVDAVALALPAEAVEAAVPVLEQSLARHPELTVDLVPTDEPAALLGAGCVLVGDVAAEVAERARRLGVAIVS
jgi:glycosyltransferase involved in cell wall biosynthesis